MSDWKREMLLRLDPEALWRIEVLELLKQIAESVKDKPEAPE